jgi:hypothetical protein
MLSRLWVAIKRSNVLDEAVRDVALKIVDYCLGHAVAVPGLFDPRAPGPMPVGRRAMRPKRIADVDRKSAELLPLPDLREESIDPQRVVPRASEHDD